jgi:hypothetical protein
MRTAIVPAWVDEWGLLLLIAVVVGAAVVRPRKWLIATAIVVCIGALGIRESSWIPVARRLIHERQTAGAWSRDYSDGVGVLVSYALATGRYVAVAGLGLAVLAMRRCGSNRLLKKSP